MCLKLFVPLYHGKSPRNHHLGLWITKKPLFGIASHQETTIWDGKSPRNHQSFGMVNHQEAQSTIWDCASLRNHYLAWQITKKHHWFGMVNHQVLPRLSRRWVFLDHHVWLQWLHHHHKLQACRWFLKHQLLLTLWQHRVSTARAWHMNEVMVYQRPVQALQRGAPRNCGAIFVVPRGT